MTKAPIKVIPRTDTILEAMQIPPIVALTAEKDREELLRPIAAWLIEHVAEGQIVFHDEGLAIADGEQFVFLAPTMWVMVRPNDIALFTDEEFWENYEAAPLDDHVRFIDGPIPETGTHHCELHDQEEWDQD